MKNTIKKATKFESSKSLDGSMKFLKGNVGKINKNGNTGLDTKRGKGPKGRA
jgi:hypothetical protein